MPPRSVDDLNAAEQMLLLCLRRSRSGQSAGPSVHITWRLACGDRRGAGPARAFACLCDMLAAGARRTPAIQAPGERWISPDERSVLVLLSACQAGAFTLASELARWLVRPKARARLLAGASTLAFAMQRAGLELRPPDAFRTDLASRGLT